MLVIISLVLLYHTCLTSGIYIELCGSCAVLNSITNLSNQFLVIQASVPVVHVVNGVILGVFRLAPHSAGAKADVTS